MSVKRVAFEWTGPSAPLITQFYFDSAGGTAQQAADAALAYLNACVGQLSTALAFVRDNEVREFNEQNGNLIGVEIVTNAQGAGVAAGPRLDLLQGLVTWSTGVVIDDRLLRGRTFMPMPTEDHNTTLGAPEVAGYVTPITAAAVALVANATSVLVVWHRPVKDENGTVTRFGSIHPVISGACGPRWSFLKTRRI